MVGSSPVILIYLNKQFDGVIIDKRAKREAAVTESLLHYCCRSVNYKLLFAVKVWSFIVQLNCFARKEEVLGIELKEMNVSGL